MSRPSCRHCHGELVRCPNPVSGICNGWKHADYAESQPAISHYCGGRSVNPLAEPDVPWRAGRKVGRTVYAQEGREPSDSDPLIGVMDSPELAAEACAGHNALLAERTGSAAG